MGQAPAVADIRIKVQDDGLPVFSATQCFQVTVTSPVQPRFASASSSGPGVCRLQVAGDAGPDYNLYASTNLRQWDFMATTSPAVLPFGFVTPTTNPARRFFRVQLGP